MPPNLNRLIVVFFSLETPLDGLRLISENVWFLIICLTHSIFTKRSRGTPQTVSFVLISTYSPPPPPLEH